MGLFDQHLHSHHSFDSKAEPADNVRCAIEAGLAGLTFTEHFDTHPDEWPDCRYDEAAMAATIRHLRAEFGQDVFIGKGIEVCYQPPQMERILDHLSRHPFDLVILSVHYFAGASLHDRAAWDGLTPEEVTRRYLETVLEAARFVADLHEKRGPVFHVLGHLDLCKRYTYRFFKSYDLSPHAGLVDEVLQACLAGDLIPEINTSTLRQGLDETMPGPAVAQRYAELGGRAMSLGSDAHVAKHVGAGFEVATRMLHDAGLSPAIFCEGVRVGE